MYFIALLELRANVFAMLNAVGLGSLLNSVLISSIESTLLPTDSRKSWRTLLANRISVDNTLDPTFKKFSLTRSKSYTQFKSAIPTASITWSTTVWSVDNPTETLATVSSW